MRVGVKSDDNRFSFQIFISIFHKGENVDVIKQEMTLSKKCLDIFESLRQTKSSGSYEHNMKMLDKILETYDSSEEDLFDLFYLGSCLYKPGLGVTHNEVSKKLVKHKQSRKLLVAHKKNGAIVNEAGDLLVRLIYCTEDMRSYLVKCVENYINK